MKTLLMHCIAVLIVAICPYVLQAQAPERLIDETVVNNATGTLMANRAVGVRITILQGSASGTEVYKETHTPTTNTNGVARVEIGGGSVVSGTFSTIDWSAGPYYLKREIDITGGSSFTQSSTQQLLSAAFALYASTSGSGGGFTHYVGEYYGGGVVFHVWKDSSGVEHGLVVSTTNQSTSQVWSDVEDEIGSSAQSGNKGLNNSNAIVVQSLHTTSAAKLCLDLVNAGQSDWYLPAIDELSLLWHNRFTVNTKLATISGATLLTRTESYWSSTETGVGFARRFDFDFGAAESSFKSTDYYVRAIRRF
jgi:hypothetical protein